MSKSVGRSEEMPTLEETKRKFEDLWSKYHGKRGGFTLFLLIKFKLGKRIVNF